MSAITRDLGDSPILVWHSRPRLCVCPLLPLPVLCGSPVSRSRRCPGSLTSPLLAWRGRMSRDDVDGVPGNPGNRAPEARNRFDFHHVQWDLHLHFCKFFLSHQPVALQGTLLHQDKEHRNQNQHVDCRGDHAADDRRRYWLHHIRTNSGLPEDWRQ